MLDGIYILANDVVYDQLVALLNSIEKNVGSNFPVCIIPYDLKLEKVRTQLETRKQVSILDKPDILSRWEKFADQIWHTHPSAFQDWQKRGVNGVNRLGMHRRFCGFDDDAPFARFIYLDGDTLVLNSLDFIFQQLDESDCVVYDFQYKDPSHVYNVNSSRLCQVFPEARVKSEIFCAGMYASKRGLFPQAKRDWLISQLQSGDGEILYPYAPDQSILNYMLMKSGIAVYNFSLNLPAEEKTGCCVTSVHFEMQDNLLYDKGVRLTYLHYIGISAEAFTRLCGGENMDIPYRDIFLYYRYLHEPEKCPQFTNEPQPWSLN